MTRDTRTEAGGRRKRMKKIYVCSPCRPVSESRASRKLEMDQNTDRVHAAMRLIIDLGHLPLAPHSYFTAVLSDSVPDERKKGMELGLEWLADADECWCFGSRVSEGMAAEIDNAIKWKIPVRFMPEPTRLNVNIIKAVLNGEMEERHEERERRTGAERQEPAHPSGRAYGYQE